jgi:hypothetical protein
MTLQQRPLSKVLPAASPMPAGRGWWNWQRVAQGVWIVLALVLLVIFVANIPAYYQSSRTGCTLPNPGDCATGLLTPGNFQALAQLHLSGSAVAGFLATLTLAVSVLYWVVGLLIFWRKSQEWMGLFVSLLLVMFGAAGIFGFLGAAHTPRLVQLLTNITYIVLGTGAVVFLFTFPTGRFTPRWTWAAFVLYLLPSVPFVALVLTNLIPVGVQVAVSNLTNLIPVGVQVYRYVRVYDAVQRQQTKWVVFAFGVGVSFLIIYYVLGSVVPSLSAPDSWYQLLNALTWLLLWALLLLCIGIAILRYRLWDIDLLINRALVYGSLTVLLVGLYVGLILALQALVRALTGSLSQQPLVLVGSTLAIAALFQPLRRRIQASIDRRFYRRKYDAAKTLAAFSATLRNEANLDQLSEELVMVVQETMQPAHVSLWLCHPHREDKRPEARTSQRLSQENVPAVRR